MPQVISIQEVGTALGQYCTNYGTQINQSLQQGLEIETMFPMVSADKAYQGQDAAISDVLQPYQKGFTPNNTETYDGILSLLHVGKVDMLFDWEEMQKFYDKWRLNWFEAGRAEQDWTYPRFVMDQLVTAKLTDNLNKSSYYGEYAAPTAGTPGAFLTTFNGLKKKIEDLVTAGTLAPLNTGALDDNTMVAQVKAFVKQMPVEYRFRKGTLLMSKTNALRYAEDFQAKHPNRKVEVENGQNQNFIVDHMNKQIVGLNSMEGSNRIIAQFDNMPGIIVINRTGFPRMPQFRTHIVDREVHVLSELYRDYSFETIKHTFVNELA